LGQYSATLSPASSRSRTAVAPHRGQCAGMCHRRSSPVRRSGTGPTTYGITSPARTTCTQSPSRRSFAATWSALCSVA